MRISKKNILLSSLKRDDDFRKNNLTPHIKVYLDLISGMNAIFCLFSRNLSLECRKCICMMETISKSTDRKLNFSSSWLATKKVYQTATFWNLHPLKMIISQFRTFLICNVAHFIRTTNLHFKDRYTFFTIISWNLTRVFLHEVYSLRSFLIWFWKSFTSNPWKFG